MGETDRLSGADVALLYRLNVRLRGAAELQALVNEHFAATYALKTGDRIDDDGSIVRATESA